MNKILKTILNSSNKGLLMSERPASKNTGSDCDVGKKIVEAICFKCAQAEKNRCCGVPANAPKFPQPCTMNTTQEISKQTAPTGKPCKPSSRKLGSPPPIKGCPVDLYEAVPYLNECPKKKTVGIPLGDWPCDSKTLVKK